MSKSEYFRRQFGNSVGDSEQTYSFLDLIRKVWKTLENISTSLTDKIADKFAKKTEIATAFNDYIVQIGENSTSRLPKVHEFLISKNNSDLHLVISNKRRRSFKKQNESCK